MVRHLKIDELGAEHLSMADMEKMHRWLERGDGIAVYENVEIGHPELGHRKWMSYGSPAAQLETDTPPERLPDGLPSGAINWRYHLVGVYRPDDDIPPPRFVYDRD